MKEFCLFDILYAIPEMITGTKLTLKLIGKTEFKTQ